MAGRNVWKKWKFKIVYMTLGLRDEALHTLWKNEKDFSCETARDSFGCVLKEKWNKLDQGRHQ